MKTVKSLDIGHTVKLADGQPVGIFITYKPETLQMVGVLKETLEHIAESELPVVRLLTSLPSPGQILCGYVIVDAAGKEDKIKQLIRKIKKLEYVEDVEVYYPSKSGMLTATPFDVLKVSGMRGMVWVKPMFKAFIRTFQEMVGTGGSAIIYNMGYIIGKEAFHEHMKIAGSDKREALEVSRNFFKASGLGSVEFRHIDVKKGKAIVRVYNSFECELFPNIGRPASQFIRGIVAGWISALLEKEVETRETKCLAKGDPFCEYVIRAVDNSASF